MNQHDKQFALEVIVAVLLCAGVWHLFISPSVQKHDELKADIGSSPLVNIIHDREAFQEATHRANAAYTRAKWIQHRSEPARNTALMHTQIKEMAKQHSVMIFDISLTPTSAARGPLKGTQTSAFTVGLVGSYQRIASFLKDLSHAEALLRMTSLRIVTDPNLASPQVRVTLQLQLFSIAAPDLLFSKMEDQPHDE